MFIDIIGDPLSPMSVAGMSRRTALRVSRRRDAVPQDQDVGLGSTEYMTRLLDVLLPLHRTHGAQDHHPETQ